LNDRYVDGVQDYEHTFQLTDFDLESVLKNGSPLLASGGREFDLDLEGKDAKERLATQKAFVRKTLGMEMSFMEGTV
jgi:hypothetical protein